MLLQGVRNLRELVKNDFLVWRGYADSGVPNRKHRRPAVRIEVCGNTHLADLCKLQRVRYEVTENLRDFAFIRLEPRNLTGSLELQFHIVPNQGTKHAAQGREKVGHFKVGYPDVDPSGLHFGEVKEVIDEFEQVLSRTPDEDDLFFLLFR